jgi:hypothetical protein
MDYGCWIVRKHLPKLIDSAVLKWYNGVNLGHRCADPTAASSRIEAVTRANYRLGSKHCDMSPVHRQGVAGVWA